MSNRKLRLLLPGFGIIGALAVLLWISLGDSGGFAYYLSVGEFLDRRPGPLENFRVNGTVQDGSVVLQPSGLAATFVITDGSRSMPVRYRGPVDESLADGADVVLEGTMDDDGTFVSDFMLAKCPSKYEAAGVEHPDEVPRYQDGT